MSTPKGFTPSPTLPRYSRPVYLSDGRLLARVYGETADEAETNAEALASRAAVEGMSLPHSEGGFIVWECSCGGHATCAHCIEAEAARVDALREVGR